MKSGSLKIGIVGCGAIGSAIAKHCSEKLSSKVQLKALFDLDNAKAGVLARDVAEGVEVASSLGALTKTVDLVVEAASADAACDVLEKAVAAKKDCLIMSVGGIVEREDLFALAGENGCRVYIPSGAVCGLDGVKAAGVKRIDEAVLTTRKPPTGLKGARYITENRIDLDLIKQDTAIFEGSAREAIKAFPRNINVSCALSMAGIGVDRTKVKIVCSPGAKKNAHEIELKGEFGSLFIRVENVPSPENPKTSYLAVLSAIKVIEDMVGNIRLGT